MKILYIKHKITNAMINVLGVSISTYITRKNSTMRGGILRMKSLGIRISTIIDVGASDGRWSRECMTIFPDVNYLLIEAQKEHEAGLKKLQSKHPQVHYDLQAAGEKEGEISFAVDHLFGGAALPKSSTGSRTVPMTTIDACIQRRQLPGPYAIKLDVHGYELPILQGAVQTMANTRLLIIECYNFRLHEQSLRFFEMCQYMEKQGFSCIDLVDPLRRPQDHAFWQMDLFFIPSKHPVFLDNTYQLSTSHSR